MQRLIKMLQAMIKTLFSDVRTSIVSIAVVSIVAGSGGVLLFVESIRISLSNTMKSNMPVWATIALAVVVVVYIYLKTRSSHPPINPKPRIEFFTTGKMKWKVAIYREDWFEIDKTPFCTKHDVQFIFGVNERYCPGYLEERCNNKLKESGHFKVYSSIKSMIESKIRNGEKLC